MSSVELKKIGHSFGSGEVLRELNLAIESGHYVVLLGPSGCGKTTILRMIAGLQSPDRGSIWIDGKSVGAVSPLHRDVSMVFQGNSLYPHLTVRQSIRFALKGKLSSAEIDEREKEAVGLTKINSILDRLPKGLSGGELRRAAIARAIARRCSVRLLDEPLSALDVAVRRELQADILQWHAATPGTSIHVTHDGSEAVRMADRIAVLDRGRVVQFATPNEIYAAPQTLSAAMSIGTPAMNLIPASLRDGHLDCQVAGMTLVNGLRVSGSDRKVWLGVRAEDLDSRNLANAAIQTRSQVRDCRRIGGELHLRLSGQSIVAIVPELDLGEVKQVCLSVSCDAMHCFDATSGERLSLRHD